MYRPADHLQPIRSVSLCAPRPLYFETPHQARIAFRQLRTWEEYGENLQTLVELGGIPHDLMLYLLLYLSHHLGTTFCMMKALAEGPRIGRTQPHQRSDRTRQD